MANWKLLGLAGVGGVAAAGVLLSRKRRDFDEPSPDELRQKLHDRLASSATATGPDTASEATEAAEE